MVSFIKLPEDVLIAIYANISPRDVLSLNQTCRSLYFIGCIDYVWHKLDYDLPLDIHQDSGTQKRHNHHEIRQSVRNSLKVDADWKNKDTVADIQEFNTPDDIDQVQLLRDDWLIMLSTRLDIRLSAWNIKTDRCVEVDYDFFGITSFAASVRDDGKTATIAVCQNMGLIEVLILTLDEEDVDGSNDDEHILLKRVSMIHIRSPRSISLHLGGFNLFTDVQVNGNVVAASMKRFESDIAPHFQWMVANIETGACMRVGIDLEQDGEEVEEFHFKLFPEHIVCLSSSASKGLLYAHDISHISSLYGGDEQMHSQDQLWNTFCVDDQPSVKPGWPKELMSPLFRNDMKIVFAKEPITKHQQIISFLSSSLGDKGLFCLHLTDLISTSVGPKRFSVEPVAYFSVPSYETCPHLIGLGQTGLRMIWFDWHPVWDENYAMKFTFPKEDPTSGVVMKRLLLDDSELFSSDACKALWFQEATGRLCLTFHGGDVIIMNT